MSKKITRLGIAMLGAWLLVSACAKQCQAEPGPTREVIVKAAFIYNFAQFVEWPADSFANGDSPIVIGIVGEDPIDGALDQAVRGKRIGGRPIVVQKFRDAASIGPCHILYVGAAEADNTTAILAKVGDTTLSIGDFDGFTARGGTFRFFLEENKMRFEVNMDAAHKLRLKISSKLLKLARVYGE